MIGPGIVLAAIVAVFHVSAYVFVRGKAGARVPLLFVAAFLGAWAGDALAARLGTDPVRIGDFHLLAASVLAWAGIAIVAILAVLAPEGSSASRVPAAAAVTERGRAERPPAERPAAGSESVAP